MAPTPPPNNRAVLIGVIVLALVAFVVGTSRWSYDLDNRDTVMDDGDDRERAPSYTDLRQTPRGSGSGWAEGLEKLREEQPGLLDEVFFDGTDLDGDLADRADRRAFDGAPPVIPHGCGQLAAPSCLACHEDGARFDGRIASPMSHKELPSCTQCHVPSEHFEHDAELVMDPRMVDNAFVGMESPTEGPRASLVAPPQIPHRFHMRERCDSCHGVNGRAAMRSSHPARFNCTQCHTTQADVDMRPGGDLALRSDW